MGSRFIDEDYEYIARIARGSFGDVFRARSRRDGSLVAIKRLASRAPGSHAQERFVREMEILARVRHPNIVKLVGFGTDTDGHACIVLEWLDGTDLARARREHTLTRSEGLEIVKQIASGLEVLHFEGVVHRDVKPANIFVSRRDDGMPHARLVDLGVAAAAFAKKYTVAGARVGTPAYMSPEQALGVAEITFAADVWSLGVVLYEIVTGRRPYASGEPLDVMHRIVTEEPAPITASDDVDRELARIVMRCVRKRPEDRYESMYALLSDLVPIRSVGGEFTPRSDRFARSTLADARTLIIDENAPTERPPPMNSTLRPAARLPAIDAPADDRDRSARSGEMPAPFPVGARNGTEKSRSR